MRQYAMREMGGCPSGGMCPEVFVGDRPLGKIVVLIVYHQPQFLTARFRHMVKSTFDPKKRYENAVRFLASEYYVDENDFSDQLAASFNAGSSFAKSLVQAGQCRLEFGEGKSRYMLVCTACRLDEKSPMHRAVYWHNHLFNPQIPPDLQVLAFTPDWAQSRGGDLSANPS